MIGQSDENGACCLGLVSALLHEDQAVEPAKLFKVLGDPVRLRLLSVIASRAGGEVCVCDLSPAFDLAQPTISHHLKLLRQACLIDCERRGNLAGRPTSGRCARLPPGAAGTHLRAGATRRAPPAGVAGRGLG